MLPSRSVEFPDDILAINVLIVMARQCLLLKVMSTSQRDLGLASVSKISLPICGSAGIIDTESYQDLQENYRAYNFVSELEIRTVWVLSRPYNQGTYGRCAGMARRPLTV
jgi:hypothetical protein